VMVLEDVVEEIAPRLLRFCLGYCGDEVLAEEAAQDGLTALVQRWRRHGPPDSPEAFAVTVAKRRIGRARVRSRLLAPLELLGGRADPGPDPERSAGGRQRLDRVLTALGALSGEDREALLLASVVGLAPAEVAALTGMSRGAAKNRVHRARRRLAAALGRQGDG
jgi:RNA polymerase sigma factor (sigma-70 family)